VVGGEVRGGAREAAGPGGMGRKVACRWAGSGTKERGLGREFVLGPPPVAPVARISNKYHSYWGIGKHSASFRRARR
jgi:hypothetical protein